MGKGVLPMIMDIMERSDRFNSIIRSRPFIKAFLFAVMFFSLPLLYAKDCLVILKGNKSLTIQAEVADTEALRSKGLMKRKKIDRNKGMLFIFKKPGNYEFWMKDTFIPLTIIFFGDDQKVIKILDMEPLNEKKRYAPGKPYRYALEINQKITEKIGLQENSSVLVLKGQEP